MLIVLLIVILLIVGEDDKITYKRYKRIAWRMEKFRHLKDLIQKFRFRNTYLLLGQIALEMHVAIQIPSIFWEIHTKWIDMTDQLMDYFWSAHELCLSLV